MKPPPPWADTPAEVRAWVSDTEPDRPDLDDVGDPPPLSAGARAALVREVAFWQASGA